MKQRLLFILTVFIFMSCKTSFKVVENPTNYTTVIKKRKLTGVVFAANSTCLFCDSHKNRFTPTLEEVEKAESIIRKDIEKINNPLISQGDGCPIIHKKLQYYKRQYFGYVDESGNKIIETRFSWNRFTIFDKIRGYSKDESENWKHEKEMVSDGCSHYWEVSVNITEEKLFGLSINGEG